MLTAIVLDLSSPRSRWRSWSLRALPQGELEQAWAFCRLLFFPLSLLISFKFLIPVPKRKNGDHFFSQHSSSYFWDKDLFWFYQASFLLIQQDYLCLFYNVSFQYKRWDKQMWPWNKLFPVCSKFLGFILCGLLLALFPLAYLCKCPKSFHVLFLWYILLVCLCFTMLRTNCACCWL